MKTEPRFPWIKFLGHMLYIGAMVTLGAVTGNVVYDIFASQAAVGGPDEDEEE